jgi:hypothetical protein
MFRSNERDWLAPNPPAGAWINVYLKSAPQGTVTVTIADKAGKTVRTLRQRGDAGVNRFVWNLRYDAPGALAAQAPTTPSILRQAQDSPEPGRGATGSGQGGRGGGAGAAGSGAPADEAPAGGRFGGGNQGPAVLPGDYTVKVNAGGRELSSQVTVMLDPGVQASAADLDAQLQASFAAQALQARVNAVVERVDTMIGQLSAIDGQWPRQNPPPYAAQVKQALDTLKKFKDDELVRPIPGLGYRQYPRLREDVQSLAGYVGRGFRAPNAGELERMKDLTAQVDQAVAKVNGLIAKDIAAINDAMKAAPRIAVEPVK